MLKATGIIKTFRDPRPFSLLKGLSLEVKRKEKIAVMGSSGAGKTTLLHILGTLETADAGSIEIFGNKADRNLHRLRNEWIGFIFQSFFLIEHFTVLQNVLIPAAIARKPIHKKSAAYQRALYLLDRVGLKNRMLFPASHLSGGEKQRTAIARALCNNPPLILADEPTGNLDRETGRTIQDLLLEIPEEEEKALVVVTHDPEFARKCDRIFLLEDGLLREDPWNSVFS